jgi:flavin-binding protein dodecin
MNDTIGLSRAYPAAVRSGRSGRAAAKTFDAGSAVEFVGASDETIAEAVRQALAQASHSLRTLEGVGVLVIPQIVRQGPAPRYRVTLQITSNAHDASASSPAPPTR